MFSFLNLSFDFAEGSSSTRSVDKKAAQPIIRPWRWEPNTSPATSISTLTPRSESYFTPPPARQPTESPEACAGPGVKRRQSVRKKRRSSVFFKLPPDLDEVLGGGRNPPPPPPRAPASAVPAAGQGSKRREDDASAHNKVASKFGLPAGGSSRRRSRRASVAPEGCSPGRTRADRAAAAEKREKNAADESRRDVGPREPWIGAAAAAAAAAAEESTSCYGSSNPSRRRRGTMLVTVGEDGPAPAGAADQDDPRDVQRKKPSPRSSPRALSAGHRRESCRDGRVINRVPKGLNAARLLEDAQDVARIRQQANLRAKMEGVCWVASNWRVGDRKGVLSGKRFLVLCDNIVWAELREADRRCSLGEGTRRKQAGFMPIIALEGATVRHHEVTTSNNGWIIEVVNPLEDVTLWLDPDNPTALLRWGSVLCQALQQTLDDDDDDENDFDHGGE